MSPLNEVYKVFSELNKTPQPFDLDQYLNEHDEQLSSPRIGVDGQSPNNRHHKYLTKLLEPSNTFELYTPKPECNPDLVDEETELGCIWPEKFVGRKLLIELKQLKFNLNYPVFTGASDLTKSTSTQSFCSQNSPLKSPQPTLINVRMVKHLQLFLLIDHSNFSFLLAGALLSHVRLVRCSKHAKA